MTPKERFIAVLDGQPITGRVPHFELEFFLTMETFGRVHPSQRGFHQWAQMSETERTLHRNDVADLHLAWVRKYEWSGVLYNSPRGWDAADTRKSLEHFAEQGGGDYLVTLHGDCTYGLPNGSEMMDFVAKLADDPESMHDLARRKVENSLKRGRQIRDWGVVDGFCLCSDYCFNDNPFLSPTMFDEFITPYLKELIAGYRELGFYVIKHTDGNIMPILDSLVSCNPHALHSIDPQGGVDLAAVKRRIGDNTTLIGNVNCALLQNGTDEEVKADVRRALRDGMPGGRYIFSTSNCIYTGMSLARYELMLDVWRKEGNYK